MSRGRPEEESLPQVKEGQAIGKTCSGGALLPDLIMERGGNMNKGAEVGKYRCSGEHEEDVAVGAVGRDISKTYARLSPASQMPLCPPTCVQIPRYC